MSLTEAELNARFEAAKSGGAPAKPTKTRKPVVETEEEEVAVADEKPKRKRKAKAEAEPEPTPEAQAGSLAETLTELAAELAEAEAAVDAIKSRVLEACS